MDTTRPMVQITEWAPPTEFLFTAPKGCSHCGAAQQFERVSYLVWCLREAKRLNGRIKKSTLGTGNDKHSVIAVFA